MDFNAYTHQCWPTSKNLHISVHTGCNLEDLRRGIKARDEWRKRERERESPATPGYEHKLMMMMMIPI